MLKIKHLLLYMIGILLTGCSGQDNTVIPIASFDLSAVKQMNMSEFVDSIRLIPLETNDSSLIRRVKEFNIIGTNLLVKDGNCLLSFNQNGDFLYSTCKLQGAGPQQYFSAVGYTILPAKKIEIFDAVKSQLITYDDRLDYVSHLNLPKEIFPTSGYIYLSKNYRLFIDKALLKLYSIPEKKIISTCQGEDIPHFTYFHRNGFLYNKDAIYVSTQYENTLYKLVYDSVNIHLSPICRFDFGETANFNLSDLPQERNNKYYQNYTQDNEHLAFVSGKYADGDKYMCFFTYGNRSYFAYKDESQKINQVYYNVPMQKQQFLPASLYSNQTFYYVCEPQYLDYVIDKSLMSRQDLKKMDSIQEDDNPIIVCYKLKS